MTATITISKLDTLVQQHLPIVYAAARRQCDAHDAADVTQAVFLILQRKLPNLPPEVILPTWLLRVTRYACLEAARRRRRRTIHEQRASAMCTCERQMEISDLSPLLDEALHRLSEKDRTAIVLAYLQELPHEEVGRQMGLSTQAAHKRIQRALARLRAILMKRTGGVSVAALGGALSLAARPAPAPAGVHAAVMATMAGESPAAIQFLAKGTLLMMNVLKVQTAGMVAATALAVSVLGMTVIPPAWSGPQAATASPAAAPATANTDADAWMPVVTLTLQEFRPGNSNVTVDLDTGATTIPPWGQPSQPPFGVNNWAGDSGTDLAFPQASHLTGFDLASVVRPVREFGIAGPAQVMTQLMNSFPTTENLSAQSLPAMYVFRTREGGVGMMEVVSATAATGPGARDAGIQVRYKMLTTAARDRNARHFANLMILPAIEEAQQSIALQAAPADILKASRVLARTTASLREITKGTPHAALGRATATAGSAVLDAAQSGDVAQVRPALETFTQVLTPAAAAIRKPALP